MRGPWSAALSHTFELTDDVEFDDIGDEEFMDREEGANYDDGDSDGEVDENFSDEDE